MTRVRKHRHAGVKIQSPAVADDFAEGKIELITHHASAEALGLVAGRKHKRQTRRERWRISVLHECLQTVVKPHVCHAVVVFRKDVRNRVRELVCLTEYRPFLSKTRGDFTRAVGEIDWQVEYVLNNARLLIVRFFDEKGVILDPFGERLGGDQVTERQEIRQWPSRCDYKARSRSEAKTLKLRELHIGGESGAHNRSITTPA